MSITGTGTQADPYIVTTFAELVEKAAESDKYVKVGNDIDVMSEYPNGDAPAIVVNSFIDGGGKTVNRWYNKGSGYLINFDNTYDKYISDLKFTNIHSSGTLIYNTTTKGFGVHSTLRNCAFAGIVENGYVFGGANGVYSGSLNGVSVNIKGNDLMLFHDYTANYHINCNIRLETNAASIFTIHAGGRTVTWDGCYFDITAPSLTALSNNDTQFSNCVLDIRTDNPVVLPSGVGMNSIFNTAHAPNVSETAMIKGVPDDKWLDSAYLASTGFSVVTDE